MQFIDFQSHLAEFPIFSLLDILKMVPDFNRIQLDRWEKKRYLIKIKKGFYCFSQKKNERDFLFYSANKIYSPSYVSLEMALKFYGFIPEEIFQITSVSTKKTADFQTPLGNFTYRQIKPSLYFGYRLVEFGQQKLLIAEPEKAILDYLYLHPRLKTMDDFEEMRINITECRSQMRVRLFNTYLELFDNKKLSQRANIFLKLIQHDNT